MLCPGKLLHWAIVFSAGYGIAYLQFRSPKLAVTSRASISAVAPVPGPKIPSDAAVTPLLGVAVKSAAAVKTPVGSTSPSEVLAPAVGCDLRTSPVCSGVAARKNRAALVDYWRNFTENEEDFAKALSEVEEREASLTLDVRGAVAVQRAIYNEYLEEKNAGRKLSPDEMAALSDRFEPIGSSSEEGDTFYGILDRGINVQTRYELAGQSDIESSSERP